MPEDDARLYSEEQIAKIVAATGTDIPADRRQELADRLEQAAEHWRIQEMFAKGPTAKMNQVKFSRIEKAAAKLLKELGVEDALSPSASTPLQKHPFRPGLLSTISKAVYDRLHLAATKKARPGKSGISLLLESVTGIVQLRQWAISIANAEAERENERRELSGQENPRRTKEQSQKYWINDLSRIYQDIWGLNPGLTWHVKNEVYSGKFFNFIRFSIDVIGVDINNDALASSMKRAKKIRDSQAMDN